MKNAYGHKLVEEANEGRLLFAKEKYFLLPYSSKKLLKVLPKNEKILCLSLLFVFS
jgi:hypothetical protein